MASASVVFSLAMPLLVVSFLLADRSASSIAADYLSWLRVNVLKGSPQPSSQTAAGSAHDRLLGGLLSPDFDEATCLSRYEASRRWKPSPFPVSPYLVQKLRKYEANHRRCGPGTARYREAMAQLMSGGRDAGGHAACKYVVWLPRHGVGNRMLSVVSTFLYALLAGRVLLVHEPPGMEGLFCEPFPGTSWRLPPEFPYKQGGFSPGSNESYASMLENHIVRARHGGGNSSAGAAAPPPPHVYLDLESVRIWLRNNHTSYSELMEGFRDSIENHTDYLELLESFTSQIPNHLFCDEDHRVLDTFTWVVLRSDSYFAAALFLVPAYRGELDEMFPAKGSVFHHLGRYLLHPGNRAWGIVERFYDGYLAGADELVGVQVRVSIFSPAPFEAMHEQILRCAREHGLLPPVTNSSEPAKAKTKAKAKKKAVLVVSLKPEYYESLRSMFYTNATATGEVVAVLQPSHDKEQRSEDRAHNERALAEIYLLSYCDEVVATGWSTFGYAANALAGLRPWLLTPLDSRTMRADVACVRAASVEPCLHSPPSLAVCRAAAGRRDLDPVAQAPFLRRCEDVGRGIKLFD